MTNLPPQPPCYPIEGVIACPCATFRDKQARNACTRARIFWLACKAAANYPTNRARKAHADLIGSRFGEKAREQFVAGTKLLMAAETVTA